MNRIEPRFYRNLLGSERFHPFVIGYKDSDLWIGINPHNFNLKIPEFAKRKLVELRRQLEAYLLIHPEFATSLTPIKVNHKAPDIARFMANAALRAQTGPMAAVAGAFSEYLGKAIQREFEINEIVVENGGDIYLLLKEAMVLSVYAGQSPLSNKIGIEIPAIDTPLGICTSAATVGPSKSFGNADAVMVACKNTALADAFATAIANKVHSASDIDPQLKASEQLSDIQSLMIICEGTVGLRGNYPLKIIAKN